jgi:hypothetical protein
MKSLPAAVLVSVLRLKGIPFDTGALHSESRAGERLAATDFTLRNAAVTSEV